MLSGVRCADSARMAATEMVAKPSAELVLFMACFFGGRVTLVGGSSYEDEGVALAAAPAEGYDAGASAAPFERQRLVQHQAGARGADGVAQGNGAAFDIQGSGVDAKIVRGLDQDRREGLVDFHQVKVLRAEAFVLEGALDGPGWLRVQGSVRSGSLAVRADLGDPLQPGGNGGGLAGNH